MDCFAPLAMTAQRLIVCGCLKLGSRHCEERSDEAIHSFFARLDGLLRFARNDGSTPNPSPGSHLSTRRSRSFASASFAENGRRRRPMLSHKERGEPNICIASTGSL